MGQYIMLFGIGSLALAIGIGMIYISDRTIVRASFALYYIGLVTYIVLACFIYDVIMRQVRRRTVISRARTPFLRYRLTLDISDESIQRRVERAFSKIKARVVARSLSADAWSYITGERNSSILTWGERLDVLWITTGDNANGGQERQTEIILASTPLLTTVLFDGGDAQRNIAMLVDALEQ